MKRTWQLLFLTTALTIVSGLANAGEKPDKALCPVCATHGEGELEKVKAEAEHDGKAYYFCSEGCKKEFIADTAAYLPPVFPRPAPSFVVETLDGSDVASDFVGKVTLVDFWATWCKPCEKIMPELQQLSEKYGDKGLQVMGISIDEGEDRASKVSKYLKKRGISYAVYSDAKKTPAWHAYRVKAVPAMFLVDSEGQIVAEWRGKVDHERLTKEIDRLLSDDT